MPTPAIRGPLVDDADTHCDDCTFVFLHGCIDLLLRAEEMQRRLLELGEVGEAAVRERELAAELAAEVSKKHKQ